MKDTFAVIQIGGTQHIVSEGDQIEINRIEGKVGDKIEIDEVYLRQDDAKTEVGTPKLDCTVTAEIVSQHKGKKMHTLKYKAKSRYRRKYGHRQDLTKLKIVKISKAKATKSKASKPKAAKPTATTKKVPAKSKAKK